MNYLSSLTTNKLNYSYVMIRKIMKNAFNSDSEEIRIYLKITWIRKLCQVILGTALCLFVSLTIMTVIFFANLIFWPDILITILFWLFLGFVFAFSFTDDPCNLVKPGFVAFGHIIFIIMVYFLSIFYHYNFANVFPIAYVLSLGLFIALCISLGLTLTACWKLFVAAP